MKERIIKYFTDELDQDERIELLRNIGENDDLRNEYTFFRNIQGILSFISHPDDKEAGRHHYYRFMTVNKQKARRKLFLKITSYAAAIVLLVIGSWIGSYFYHQKDFTEEITYNKLSVPAGQRASLVLSDGTEVWLNARSEIKYPSHFTKDTRKIELQGEAFFSVISDKDRPFIVSTSSVDIKVLGTVFNVRQNKSDSSVDVSLFKGAVDVLPAGEELSKISLKPMQNLHYVNGLANVSELTDENDFLWRQGVFNFEDDPLSDICKKLEWFYDIKIIINNPKIGEYSCSGKFRQHDGPYEILRIIQNMHKYKMTKDDTNNTIILSSEN